MQNNTTICEMRYKSQQQLGQCGRAAAPEGSWIGGGITIFPPCNHGEGQIAACEVQCCAVGLLHLN